MKTIERLLGKTNKMVEFPVSVIDTKEKFISIIESHVNYYILNLQMTIDPISFKPSILAVIFSAKENEWKTFVELPLEITQENNKIIKDGYEYYFESHNTVMKIIRRKEHAEDKLEVSV